MLLVVGFRARFGRRAAYGVLISLILAVGLVDFHSGVFLSFAPLYLVPITLAVTWMGWRTGCVFSVLSVLARLAGDLAAGGYPMSADKVFWNRTADLGLYLTLVLFLHSLLSLQRELEARVVERTQELSKALAERADLQRQLFDISRRERSSIGHELHDGLGQHLTATSIAAKMLAGDLAREKSGLSVAADNIVRLLQDAIAQTRRIARGLLLSAVEPDALAPELEELAVRMQRDHRIHCVFRLVGEPPALDVSQSSHLYYIAQEAARNALRHARATRIDIVLETRQRELALRIVDNGVGLPANHDSAEGMGLRIMAHRAELLGGSVELLSTKGGGTCVSCRIPIALPPGKSKSSVH
jgi:signal transduction histidine kinase